METPEPATEVFFGPEPGKIGPGEIIGLSVSTLSSSVFIIVKNRGLFAYTLHGRLLWSVGPVFYQLGYKQGCRKNVTDCYFTSSPVIDQCQESLYISNTKGELHSLSIRSPHFNWILDISSLDKAFSITPGNNGRLYVTIPVKALVLASDVSSGNILWQGRIGPLSAADYTPVVDSNGWLSIGSLDGFLYSFSPTGTLKEHARSDVTDSSIQVSPFLDCSGYAVYMSQKKMEGKISHTIGESTYVSAMRPKGVVFTLLVPAIGSIYWSESYPGRFSYLLSESDLQHFVVDERILLAFVTASKTGNPLQCRAPYQKLASSCSQHMPKRLSFYTGSERAIVLFLFFESLLLIILAGLVRFCCIFWRKKKIQAQSLGNFLEKRHSLQLKKRAFDRTITELEKNAGDNATTHKQVIEELGDLVRQREGIQKKLSTTYSLCRDYSPSKSFLPIYNGKARSYSFQIRNKESVTIFHTLNDTSCSSTDSSWNSTRDIKGKQKANIEEDSSSDDGIYVEGYYRSPSEPVSSSRVNLNQFVSTKNQRDDGSESWLKRRSLSSPFQRTD